jgi:hypothetical protein
MSISAVFGTVIGLVFIFALAALFCSAVVESISNLIQKRARYLLTGLRSMLDEEASKFAAPRTGSNAPSADDLHDLTRGMGQEVSRDQAAAATKSLVTAITEAPAQTAETEATGDATVQDSAPQESADAQMRAGPAALPAEEPTDARRRIRRAINATSGESLVRPGDLTAALFEHPLISSLQTRRVLPVSLSWQRSNRVIRNPQYIPAKLFAQALIDTLLPDIRSGSNSRDFLTDIKNSVEKLPEGCPGQDSIKALLVQAGDNLSTFQKSLEDWYDAQMGRISGWYKRWTKVVLGVIGLLLAIIVNVDAVRIAHTLYVDEPVRQAIVAAATQDQECTAITDPEEQRRCVEDLVASVDESGLPLWYPAGCSIPDLSSHCWKWANSDEPDGRMFLVKLVGWILTAFAVSFGAPFWFDALSKLGSLRTAGPKPGSAESS